MSSGKHASIFCCFRRAVLNGKKLYFNKIRKIWTSSSCSKVFTPRLLMHRVSFWSISEPYLIVVFESLSCPQYEKMDLKIIQSLLERVQICRRCWKTEESAGHGGIFWRTVLSLTVQNKQGTHEQPSLNKRTLVDHPGNHTQY